jgi:hypothetical protein
VEKMKRRGAIGVPRSVDVRGGPRTGGAEAAAVGQPEALSPRKYASRETRRDARGRRIPPAPTRK